VNTNTYRTYADTLSLDTGGYNTASLAQSWSEEGNRQTARVEFTRSQARHLGMRLIAWTGDLWAFMLSAHDTFKGVEGTLTVDVVDGCPELRVGSGPALEVPAEHTHDMGIRLIAWAGVA